MDQVERAWNDFTTRIAAGGFETPVDLELALGQTEILTDPLALERAQTALDRFWDLVHQNPKGAWALATLTCTVTRVRGAPISLQAEALRRTGTALYALGRAQEAVVALRQGLELLETAPDSSRRELVAHRAALLGFLANALLALGKQSEALVALEEAIALAKEQRLRAPLGVYMSSLGNARIVAGEARAARDYYREALAIAVEVGNREGQAVNLNNVGLTYHALGKLDQALEHYQEALHLARDMGDPRTAATAEANVGLVYADQGDLESAEQHYEAAQQLAQRNGDQVTESSVLLRLARNSLERGSCEAAQRYAEQAGEILTELEDPRRSTFWDETGRIRLAAGDPQGAAAWFQQALAGARSVGDRRSEAVALYDLGRAATYAGHPDQGVVHLQEVLVIARDLEDQDLTTLIQDALAEAHAARGELGAAREQLAGAKDWVLERRGSILELQDQLASATVILAEGSRERAIAGYKHALADARRLGFGGVAGEATRRLEALGCRLSRGEESSR